MNSNELFARLCIIEANVHMVKARYLKGDSSNCLKHLKNIGNEIKEINDNLVSGDGTKLYIPK